MRRSKEFELIAKMTSSLTPGRSQGVLLGPGDDCAILEFCRHDGQSRSGSVACDESLLFTVDTLVENVHFRRGWSSLADVGYKLVATNASDVGAMGGSPWVGVVSCQISEEVSDTELEEFYCGINEASAQFSVEIVGGDTVSGKELSFSMALLGRCDCAPVLRRGAEPGDDLWVSGVIGDAWSGLKLLENHKPGEAALNAERTSWHRRPVPPVSLGRALAREKLASAMLDVSDGLLQDCGHIASESGVGIVIRQRDIPLAPSLEAKESVLAISSGDDYQLLFTSAPGNREKVRQAAKLAGGVDVSCIGKVVNSLRSEVLLETFQGENLRIGTDIPCAGYQHTWSE